MVPCLVEWNRKSGFRAGFRPDSSLGNIKISLPAGFRLAGWLIFEGFSIRIRTKSSPEARCPVYPILWNMLRERCTFTEMASDIFTSQRCNALQARSDNKTYSRQFAQHAPVTGESSPSRNFAVTPLQCRLACESSPRGFAPQVQAADKH